MSKRIAYFRFDASSIIGAGHAIRCSALAEELKAFGWDCSIITNQESYGFIENLNRFPRIDTQNFEASPPLHDLLVIDHYELNKEYEESFRSYAKKIIVIDDWANRHHHCNFLIDQTYGRHPSDYQDLVPKKCKVLCGSHYALLRRDFAQLRTIALQKRSADNQQVKKVLISMGGGDCSTVTQEILTRLIELNLDCQLEVVLGFSAPSLQEFSHFLQDSKVKFYSNADMAPLILEADIAVGAAGSSMWERCCLGLPTIMVSLSDDQLSIANNLYKQGAALYAGSVNNFDYEKFISLFKLVFHDQQKRIQMQKQAFEICDGYGARRVVEEINESY